MSAPRRFDWDEANRLRGEGATYAEIGRRLGVTGNAIYLACNSHARARQRKYGAAWKKMTCEDCGGTCAPNPYHPHARLDRMICRKCSSRRRREETLLKRMNHDGDLLCARCGEWRPVETFAMNYGYPRWECRYCETTRRRANREANRDRERAYERSRRRRKAAA